MTKPLDYVLDRITMYRLVLYVLIGLIGMAAILAYVHQLSFSPLALLLSTAFLVVMCWAANWLLATIFEVPTNVESAIITTLILALIIDPAKSPGDLQFLGWAAISCANCARKDLSAWCRGLLSRKSSNSCC
jgi:glycine betaine catabolism B